MFSVRGIGRRGHRQHVDLLAHLLDALLVRTPKPLLLVDDEQPEILELHVLRAAGDAVPTMTSTLPAPTPSMAFLDSCFVRKRADHVDRFTGKPAKRSRSVFWCWNASTGSSGQNRDLLTVHHRLERPPRIATSVLP
jgi:hypothetical protein